jgi:hypothetical protein
LSDDLLIDMARRVLLQIDLTRYVPMKFRGKDLTARFLVMLRWDDLWALQSPQASL